MGGRCPRPLAIRPLWASGKFDLFTLREIYVDMFASRQRRACTGVGLNRKFTVRKFSGGKRWVPEAPCKYAHTNLKSESTLVPCTYSKAGKKVAELCRKKTCCRENNRGSLFDSVGVLPGGAAALSPQVRVPPAPFCTPVLDYFYLTKTAHAQAFSLFPQKSGPAPDFCTIENLR